MTENHFSFRHTLFPAATAQHLLNQVFRYKLDIIDQTYHIGSLLQFQIETSSKFLGYANNHFGFLQEFEPVHLGLLWSIYSHKIVFVVNTTYQFLNQLVV